MKLKYQFVVREIAGEYVAAPFGKSCKQLSAMVQLNGTAAVIFEMLNSGDVSYEEIVAALQQRYDIDEATATQAADTFLDQLRDSELLDEK